MSTSTTPVPLPTSIKAYPTLFASLMKKKPSEQTKLLRAWYRADLFALLLCGLNRHDVYHPWIFDRCREVQANPDGHLDLWAREHYKSTIITFALTIQNILNDPEQTFGIFSHTRPIAKGFLRQIKREFEQNDDLKAIFPDILYQDPHKESAKWSEDDGIIVKRKGNPNAATVEAWGLVDGQPTSKHFRTMVYDDVVTRESVNTPEMIAKTTDAWALSRNLGSEGGSARYIGTRYHYNDTYREIMGRGAAIPRIHPATEDGTVEGEPVMLTRERLAEKRRDQGPYIFGCFVPGTKVLMGDWTEKEVQDVAVGDEVVGYEFGEGQRARLVRSKVLASQSRMMPVVRFEFESGRYIIGTRDHKFWQGRADRGYAPLGFAKNELSAACSVYDSRNMTVVDREMDAGYLAGIFDGEGSISGNAIHFSQSRKHHPEVCDRIEEALAALDLPYSAKEVRPGMMDYYLTGGRETKMRFAQIMKGFGKHREVVDLIYQNGTRNIGKGVRDKLVDIKDEGEFVVWNIQTETGNYVANGYAVKNCQMLQDPKADGVQGFKSDWINYLDKPVDGEEMNAYLLVDPASEKKKTSDYTAAWVLGLGADGNIYILDAVRDRLNLAERSDMVFALHRRWRPQGVGYEKYGMMADIEHMRDRMQRESYHFEITELGGPMPKPDRIRRLVPWFEQERVYFPPSLMKTDYEGTTRDLVEVFVEEEYKAFPVGLHDDMLDAMSRLLDEGFEIIWPKAHVVADDRYARRSGRRRRASWMAA